MSKIINYGPALDKRMTLRLTTEQFEYLGDVSQVLGVSPSDYIRMMVNSSMVAYRTSAVKNMVEEFKNNEDKVGMSNENVKADSNNQL